MLQHFRQLSRGPPTLAEARAEAPPVAGAAVPVKLLWGPICLRCSEHAGGTMPTSSVLLDPMIPDQVRAGALAVIPEEVLPRLGDTAQSLARRLAESTFLEDSHVLKGGKGPQRVRLNGTTYPQPRRLSWSVLVEEPEGSSDGLCLQEEVSDSVTKLLNYTAHGREPSDWRSRVMPRPIYDLGVALWHAAYPILTDASRVCPPTACQLLLYYQLFKSQMRRHRDNYTSMQALGVVAGEVMASNVHEGSHHGGDANSQTVGSYVLVYTEGDADMTFALSFPPDGDYTVLRDDYTIHPIFCVAMGAGTLLVFSPIDDLFFCHQAYFTDGQGTHRLAFVFRWLSQAR